MIKNKITLDVYKRQMIDSGDKIEFDTHPIMDKHSIGGVPGNKISLLVVPVVAANGLLDVYKRQSYNRLLQLKYKHTQ